MSGKGYTQTAQKLINQLNTDTASIDLKKPDNGNEPSFSQENGPNQNTTNANVCHNNSIPNSEGIVNTNFDDWSDPIPFEATITVPPFPIHCLPAVLRDFALAVAEHTQTPIDMSAVASLGVSSACLQGKYLVQGKVGHTEPLNNYYVEIAKPGERKSAVCAIFEEPIKAYEQRKNEAFALDIAHSANIRQVLEKEMEALKNAVAKGKKTYADMEAKQEEINKHKEIKPIRLICGDVTPEALTSLLADNHGRMAMFSAEGGIFDILKGLYSQVTNIDTFLKAHCGDSIRVDRKGRRAEFIEKPCLTTLLFIQPDVLKELVSNETFRGRGLVARFLYSFPQSTVGNRKYDTAPIPFEISDKYRFLCESMLDSGKSRDDGENGQKAEPNLLTLSTQALAKSREFYNALEPRLGKGGDLEHMADWAGKLHGAVLRIAGLIQIINVISYVSKLNEDSEEIFFDMDDPLSITGQFMDAACEIGHYFLAHAIVCYGMFGGSEAEQGAVYILDRLKKHSTPQFTTRELLKLCKKFKATADITEPLIILAEHGFIRETQPAYTGMGRPPSSLYLVNPKLFQE